MQQVRAPRRGTSHRHSCRCSSTAYHRVLGHGGRHLDLQLGVAQGRHDGATQGSRLLRPQHEGVAEPEVLQAQPYVRGGTELSVKDMHCSHRVPCCLLLGGRAPWHGVPSRC